MKQDPSSVTIDFAPHDLHQKLDADLELEPLSPSAGSQPRRGSNASQLPEPLLNADEQLLLDSKRPPWKVALAEFMEQGAVEGAILAIIMANVITMCAEIENQTMDLAICAFFTLEMWLRVLATGFYYDDDAYLRDGWNRLDCVLTLTGWLGFLLPVKLSVLRVVRLLRLQRLEAFSGIRDIVSSIAAAIPSLMDVCSLLLFAFTIYGIIGISLYAGALENRCFVISPPGTEVEDMSMSNPELFCSLDKETFAEAKPCPENMACFKFENPQGDQQSFDNIGAAFLSIFVVSTMEGWVDMMYPIQRSAASWAWVYFVTMLMFITFIVLNLFVAVVCMSYAEIRAANFVPPAEPTKYDPDKDPDRFCIEQHADGAWTRVRDHNTVLKRHEASIEPSCGRRIQLQVVELMNSVGFENFLLSVIGGNTLFLALPYYGMSSSYEAMLLWAEDVFNVIFIGEMTVKIIGCNGFVGYIAEDQNKFDFSIVMMSMPDLLRLDLGFSFSIFRAIRLMRLMRIFKNNEELMRLVEAVIMSLPAMGNLLAMIFLAQTLFVLFGMQIFGTSVPYEDLRANFGGSPGLNAFLSSNLTLFQVLSGENWTDILYAYMGPQPLLSPVFFFLWIVCGNYVLLNLFIAVITENIEVSQDVAAKQQAEMARQAAIDRMIDGTLVLQGPPSEENEKKMIDALHNYHKVPKSEQIFVPSLPPRFTPQLSAEFVDHFLKKTSQDSLAWNEKPEPPQVFASMCDMQLRLASSLKSDKADADLRTPEDEEGASTTKPKEEKIVAIKPAMGCTTAFWGYWSRRVTNQLKTVAEHAIFDNFILVIILLSSLTLAIENPYISDGLRFGLLLCDYCWCIIFTVEFVIKFGAYGPADYIADGWNKLDCVVLVVTYFSLFGPSGGGGFIDTLRIGRTLRPLRMINKNPEMKLIINSVIGSLPSVSNALILTMFVFFVFAVFGLDSFMGKFWICNQGDYDRVDCNSSEVFDSADSGDEFLKPVVWINNRQNFDDIIMSLVTLFNAATTEGWVDLMYMCMDINGVGMAPKLNAKIIFFVYWILFIFIATFAMVNLFVGVIIDNYNREMSILTEDQKRWVILRRVLSKMGPEKLIPPDNAARLVVYRVVRSQPFDILIMMAVLLNVMFMGTVYWGVENSLWGDILIYVNWFFLVFFTVEMAAKLFAFGLKQYLQDSWNVFDGIIVIGSIATIFFSAGSIAQVGRVFRIARLLRLVKRAKGLKMLFNTMLTSLPSMTNIASLMFLLYFVFAVVGTALFSKTRFGNFYTIDANFRDFPRGLLLLFRMSTGENWHEVMIDCQYQAPFCTGGVDCGLLYVAPLYFMGFFTLGVYLMLNLFIAVIIDNFSQAYNKDPNQISTDDLEQYRYFWRKFDPDGTGFIYFSQLRAFLLRLEAFGNGLTLGIVADKLKYGIVYIEMQREAKKMKHIDSVSFNGLLVSLSQMRMGMHTMDHLDRGRLEEQRQRTTKQVAATLIASVMRSYLVRKHLRERGKSLTCWETKFQKSGQDQVDAATVGIGMAI